MTLEGVRWTWSCQEPSCGFTAQTEPKAFAPACPDHGVDPVGRACAICGVEIAGRRADAETCSGPCRAEKSRRDRARNGGPEAHRGAQARRQPRPRPRAERGTRVYMLPDELAGLVRWIMRDGTRRVPAYARSGAGKVVAARERLERRSS